MMAARERGSVTVVAAGTMTVVAVLVLLSVDLAGVLRAVGRAQTAADAAALAAAQELAVPSGLDPAALAADYAARNGATLEGCACPAGGLEAVVEVRVEVGDLLVVPGGRTVRATARAVVDLPEG